MSLHLILDFGNTSCKAALFRNETITDCISMKSADAKKIFTFIHKKNISAAILASVIKHPVALEKKLKSLFPLLLVNQKTKLPVGNNYSAPKTLGYDRIAAAVGGWQLFRPSPVLAIVAGTCITYNIIDASGNFRGGAIAPGLHMRLRAMHDFTKKLPQIKLEGPHPLTGNSTETSLRAGVYHAAAAEIEGMIKRYENEFPGMKTVLGGGDSLLLAEALKNGIFARPNLVAEGLNGILEYHVANHLI